MKYSIKSPVVLALLLLSCGATEFRSSDFTEEGVFTPGIEGPAVNAEGHLFAVNFGREGTIGRILPGGKGEVFATLPEGSIGNGIRFDTKGNMFVADYLGHKVYRIPAKSRTPEVWAENTDLNQPNDLAMAPGGMLYLSDPNWADSSGKLWMLSPDRKWTLLEENMGTTNGIEVSPDGKWLYVNESVQRKVWRYEIGENGIPHGKKEFLSFADFGMDGMRCDSRGNLYITRYDKGTVLIVSPAGKQLREIQLSGKKPSNIAFGGPDGKTCYVTLADRGAVETFRALNPGSYFSLIH